MGFITKDFLLKSETAKKLYHNFAALTTALQYLIRPNRTMMISLRKLHMMVVFADLVVGRNLKL